MASSTAWRKLPASTLARLPSRRRQPMELPPSHCLKSEKSVAFVPSTWGTTIYATRDMLFLASQGYDEHPLSRSGFIQTTFILGFSLDGDGAAKGAIVGKAPGTVLNQFSMDFYDGHLRVATTTWSDWVCPFDTEDTTNDAEDVELSEPMPDMEDEPTFCGGTRTRGPQNQITVLSTESGEVMNEVGYLGGLGKPGESIYAVRFIKDKGFVVTFERIDPFYTCRFICAIRPSSCRRARDFRFF